MPAKLVAIGDSLTQGFQSGSIYKTKLSYPAMLAECLGETDFRVPDFSGAYGLPINLEELFRELADKYGPKIQLFDIPSAIGTLHSFLNQVKNYWVYGEGAQASKTGPLHQNLAVWGFQMGDCDTLMEALCRRAIPFPTNGQANFDQIPDAMYRTTRRTLNPTFDPKYGELSQLELAKKIAEQQGGIDNLIFFIGSNNCLSSVTQLEIKWSEEADIYRFSHQRTCNLWVPSHFKILLSRISQKITTIGAKNVFISTLPHVTIPPVSRGISPSADKGQELSWDGYYEYYTHFWIWDDEFAKAPDKYKKLTRDEARLIDQVINEYNEGIKTEAKNRGWHVVDLCGVLDQLAFRRQAGDTKYEFPPELVEALRNNPVTKDRFVDGKPILDTRYLRIDPNQQNPELKYRGGFFSLDGIHPTTIGYGLVAHEFLKVMQQVWKDQGENVEIQLLNWDKIVQEDTLVTNPPKNLMYLENLFGFIYSQEALPNLIRSIGGLS